MSFPPMLRLATSACFGGCLYTIFSDKRKHNLMKVNAQPAFSIFDPPLKKPKPATPKIPFTIYDEENAPEPRRFEYCSPEQEENLDEDESNFRDAAAVLNFDSPYSPRELSPSELSPCVASPSELSPCVASPSELSPCGPPPGVYTTPKGAEALFASTPVKKESNEFEGTPVKKESNEFESTPKPKKVQFASTPKPEEWIHKRRLEFPHMLESSHQPGYLRRGRGNLKKKVVEGPAMIFPGIMSMEFPNWPKYDEGGPIFPHPEVPTRSILEFKDFLLCYDNLTRQPLWTLEVITAQNLVKHNPDERKLKLVLPKNRKDDKVEEVFSSGPEDYARLGRRYRECQVADARLHPKTMDEVAVYCNVVPQGNPPRWLPKPRSESIFDEWYQYVKFLLRGHEEIWVLSGPLYIPSRKKIKAQIRYEVFGKQKVAVPTHFFKAILARNKYGPNYRLECFKIENEYTDQLDLREHHISRANLEALTGFEIFPLVLDNQVKYEDTQTVSSYAHWRQVQHFGNRQWYDQNA
uniref:Endonuclease G, mitochondrial n=1 Tax=Strigamia maritima TaxID=126957 RepID=T1JN87_STRMM